MLTDTKLRNIKPRDKLYKVNDRDGLYVAVTPAGSISFRYNYSPNRRLAATFSFTMRSGFVTSPPTRRRAMTAPPGRPHPVLLWPKTIALTPRRPTKTRPATPHPMP